MLLSAKFSGVLKSTLTCNRNTYWFIVTSHNFKMAAPQSLITTKKNLSEVLGDAWKR